ncbi:MAG: PilZ domain-containing protein [Bdellovibrionales bacterium]|nr:PilZ domain-containing protein [Bdellovibrionales bacterium]
MLRNLASTFHLSQYEMGGWELLPALFVALFFLGGAIHIIKNRRDQKKRREHRSQGDRHRLPIPLVIETPVTQSFSVTIYDISLGGAFIPLEEMQKSMNFTSLIGKRSGIKVGDLIDLKLQTGRFSQIHCQGKVVRYQEEDLGKYPKGIGIEFINVSKRDQRRLADLLDLHHLEESA